MAEAIASDTVYGYFETAVKEFGSNSALVYLGTTWSHDQLKDMFERFASSIHEMGIKRGDKVVLYISNLPQWLIAWFGLARLGVIPVPISPIYTPVDLKYIINDSGAETVLCMDTNFGYVEEVFPETTLKRIIVTNFVEMLPLWKKLLGKAFNKIPKGKHSRGTNIFPFKRLLRKPASALPPYSDLGIGGDDIAVMLYTGGTTGFPKGVPFPNRKMLTSCLAQRSLSESVIPKGEDVIVHSAPLFHTLGLVLAVAGSLAGDTCVLLPKMHLDGLMNHIERFKAKTFFGVPSLYRMVLEHKRADYYDLSSLKYCFGGGMYYPLK